jgi:hypothetical protein
MASASPKGLLEYMFSSMSATKLKWKHRKFGLWEGVYDSRWHIVTWDE